LQIANFKLNSEKKRIHHGGTKDTEFFRPEGFEMTKNTILTGATGEFFVASYLSALGLVVGLPRVGVPGVDLFVTRADGGKSLSIQVKTGKSSSLRRDKKGEYFVWRCNKAKVFADALLWYAFVYLPDTWPREESNSPEIFFVSSNEVASVIAKDDNYWVYKSASETTCKGIIGVELLMGELK
jgi:hypothetical protein